MIGTANGYRVSITGIGANVPERVMTNEELSKLVDTTDEWIVVRTGIRERRIAGEDEALSDMALPAARAALAQAGVDPADIDLLIVATVTPDMAFPATAAILADELGARDAAAYDLSAGCTGFMYAIAQAYGMLAGGVCRRALVVGGDILSKIVDWSDRATCIVFGDGAGAVVMERVEQGGFLGFELGADGAGGMQLYLPAGGSRAPTSAETVARQGHFVHMNGREVFKFATRVLVSSAEKLLDQLGLTVDDIDLYVPHQANIRIIKHAVERLGYSGGEGCGERRPVREHVLGLDSARARRRRPRSAREQGGHRADDRHGCRSDVGFRGDGMDGGDGGMNTGKIAFCFPGQGSLEAGMGRDIAEAVPEAMEVFDIGSEASGLDLAKLCFETPLEEMVETELQQPALVATSLAFLAALGSAASCPTSSSATRSASSRRWPRPAR